MHHESVTLPQSTKGVEVSGTAPAEAEVAAENELGGVELVDECLDDRAAERRPRVETRDLLREFVERAQHEGRSLRYHSGSVERVEGLGLRLGIARLDRGDELQLGVADPDLVPGDELEAIPNDASPETIEGWDSANHLNLVLSLEAEFGVQFDTDEIAELTSVGAIRQRLAAG